MNCCNYMNNGGWFINACSPLEPGVPKNRMKQYYLHLEGSVLGGDYGSVLWDIEVKTIVPILQFELFFFLTIVKIPLIMSIWAANERILLDRLKKAFQLEYMENNQCPVDNQATTIRFLTPL